MHSEHRQSAGHRGIRHAARSHSFCFQQPGSSIRLTLADAECKISAPSGDGSGSIGFGDAATGIQVSGSDVFLSGVTGSGTGAAHDFRSAPTRSRATPSIASTTTRARAFSFGGGLVDIPIVGFASKLDTSQAVAANQLMFSALLGGTGHGGHGLAGSRSIRTDNLVVAGVT